MDRSLLAAVAVALALSGCAGFPATDKASDPQADGTSSSVPTGDLVVHVESFKPIPPCSGSCPTYSWPPPQPLAGIPVVVWAGAETRTAVADGHGDASFLAVPQGAVRVTALWNHGDGQPLEQTVDQDVTSRGPWPVTLRFED